MAQSIANLRTYQSAITLEDQVFALIKTLPADQQYPLGSEMRRASTAVSHHIHQAHQRYAYALKLEELDQARQAAEHAQKLLTQLRVYGAEDDLIEGYIGIIKQSWGLTRYLHQRLNEHKAEAAARAADELAAARAS